MNTGGRFLVINILDFLQIAPKSTCNTNRNLCTTCFTKIHYLIGEILTQH